MEEAFAVVREAAWRVLELRHYDVQVQADAGVSANGGVKNMIENEIESKIKHKTKLITPIHV